MTPMLRLACTLALLVWLATTAHAQEHDSRGTEFWVAFLENYGSGGFYERSDLRLYAACDAPTTIRLRYHASGRLVEVAIPQANRPVEIDMRALFGEVEIAGGEEVSMKSIEVLADREITLYGVNVRRMSSDAFLALPADIYTRRYVVLAYQNGITTDVQGFSEIDMASQFAVVATEDGTLVRVTPAAPIAGRGSEEFTVGLDRGQVFFAQARLDGEWDLSGTVVQTTKPVAVFAGNRRTAIPAYVGNYRDHLIEQMPPIEVWGREAIVTPHYPVTPASREVAVVRVLSAVDDTEWFIDGVRQQPLDRARARELPLTRAMRITAERPILVAQYEHSVNTLDTLSEEFELGDPFMMLVPPPEQFDTVYGFQSVGHSEFLRHFVNVVIPQAGLASLRLDDMPVVGDWYAVPGSQYGYMQVELGAGAHVMRSDSAFGLFAYGYGRANSYGYVGGMAYRRLVHDFEPPDIEQAVVCGRVAGIALDDNITDIGVDSLYALPQTRNARVTIDPFERAADSVFYRAELIDPYRDGVVAMRAVDSGGRSRTQVTPIAGFTVRVTGAGSEGIIELDTLTGFNGLERCGELEIHNDGLFEQSVSEARFVPDGGAFRVTTPLPVVLAPGARATIRYCASSALDTVVQAQLVVGNGCRDRPLALATLESGTDSLPPALLRTRSGCGDAHEVHFAEQGRMRSGIVDVTFDVMVNGRVDWVTANPDDAPLGEVAFRFVALDQRRDAFLAGSVVDLAGNRIAFADTIAGFTAAFVGATGDTLSLATGLGWLAEQMSMGSERCDSLTIVNYGTQRVRITSARLDGNLTLSVPPSQLPFEIAPGERRSLFVCLEAAHPGMHRDTLTIADDCGRLERVALRLTVPAVTGSGSDACNNALSVTAIGPSKRTFLATPAPNPSRGAVTIDIGLAADAAVTLELFDANGRPAHAILRGESLRAGLHRIAADLDMLESGSYYLRLSAAGVTATEPIVVQR